MSRLSVQTFKAMMPENTKEAAGKDTTIEWLKAQLDSKQKAYDELGRKCEEKIRDISDANASLIAENQNLSKALAVREIDHERKGQGPTATADYGMYQLQVMKLTSERLSF